MTRFRLILQVLYSQKLNYISYTSRNYARPPVVVLGSESREGGSRRLQSHFHTTGELQVEDKLKNKLKHYII